MLKKSDIDRFYEDVDRLGLKFPVASIGRATGESKGNVSKILSRKLEPSESFLQRFYEKFPRSSQNVSRETNGHHYGSDFQGKYIALLEEITEERKANSKQVERLVKQNQALLMTLQSAMSRLLSKAERKTVDELDVELNKENIENFQEAGILWRNDR